jgi:O-antigen ligase
VTPVRTALPGLAAVEPERRVAGVPGPLLAVWAALFLNVLAFSLEPTILPIPQLVGQLMTQGSLALALPLALVVNRRAVMRPNLVLVLLTALALVALMVSIHSEFMLSSTFRASRLLAFVLILWLLTPWWGRQDMLLLRCHRRCLWIILGTVVVGAVVAPGKALGGPEGRLSGAIWPIPPTQVAHYAAVLLGTSTILWMCRVITGRHVAVAVLLSAVVLIGSHTRTALVAMTVALLVAGASLFLGHARVRRTSAWTAVLAVVGATVFAPQLMSWILRGQSAQEASQLTGRTKVWSAVFATNRPRIEEWFGSGLSNQSFNGLPIDSNWVASYLDQGWFGIVVQATVIVVLLLLVATRERSPQRAVALFIIVYCLVASYTETGLGGASPYLLDLVVAASLLVRPGKAAGT